MIGQLCHNKPGGTKLDGTKCRAASESFSEGDLDVKCVMVESTKWWQSGVGEEEVQFIKLCPPRVKLSAKTAGSPQFFFSQVGVGRMSKISRPTQVVQGNIPQPRLSPCGVKLWWRRNSEAVPKATLCLFTAAEGHWGYGKCASTPASWELPFSL